MRAGAAFRYADDDELDAEPRVERRPDPGKRTLTQRLASRGPRRERPAASVHEAAQAGVTGGGASLPFLAQLSEAFGGVHDLSSIRAHVGGGAADACDAIGAEAYATGADVAFRAAPDLHTAAHEAAHVVQQRAGIELAGGVGEVGDAFERHADAVADRVVAGESAAELLAPYAAGAASPSSFVQRKGPGRLWIGYMWLSPSSTDQEFRAFEAGMSTVRRLVFRRAAQNGADAVVKEFTDQGLTIPPGQKPLARQIAVAYLAWLSVPEPETGGGGFDMHRDGVQHRDGGKPTGSLDERIGSVGAKLIADWIAADRIKRPALEQLAKDYVAYLKEEAPDLTGYDSMDGTWNKYGAFANTIPTVEQVVTELQHVVFLPMPGTPGGPTSSWQWVEKGDPDQLLRDGLKGVVVDELTGGLVTIKNGEPVVTGESIANWAVDTLISKIPLVSTFFEVMGYIVLVYDLVKAFAAADAARDTPTVAGVKKFLKATQPLNLPTYAPMNETWAVTD